MFLVFNKEKIAAYVVSVITVCFLFIFAGNFSEKEKTETTSSNAIVENSIINNVNNNNSIRNTNVKQ